MCKCRREEVRGRGGKGDGEDSYKGKRERKGG
jgi:hypothetical protein